MEEEKVEVIEENSPFEQEDQPEELVNGVIDKGPEQSEDAEESSRLAEGPADVSLPEPNGSVVRFSSVPTTSQGFELAEDPTGAAPPTSANGDVPHLKGILGVAPAGGPDGDGEVKVPKQHTFYLVRVPRPDVSDIFNQISEIESKLEDKKQRSQSIINDLRQKQAQRREVAENRKEHRNRAKVISEEVQRKYDELKPMQEKVKEIREAGSKARTAGKGLAVTSRGELQQRLAEIEYTMQHESISLQEEKKLLREIQLLEKSRPEVEALEAQKTSVSDQEGHREGLQSQLKPLFAELEALKQQRDAERKIADTYNVEVEALDKELDQLSRDRETAIEARDALFTKLRTLRQQIQAKESDFYQYRRELTGALQLAAAKDIAALEAFSTEQVEKFHNQWKDKKFRASYVKNNERSTLRRFQSLDTRRPGVDEDPAELNKPASYGSEAQVGAARGKGGAKANGEVPAVEKEQVKPAKPAKAPSEEQKPKDKATAEVKEAPAVTEEAAPVKANKLPEPVAEKAVKQRELQVPDVSGGEVQAEKPEENNGEALKEKVRVEAIAKAKEAEERKRKLAEKAQARAAARAAKEAEEVAKKKEKEKQRKERKKAAAAAAAAANAPDADAGKDGKEETEEAAEATETSDVSEQAPAVEDDGLTSRQRKRNAAARRKTGSEGGKVALPQSVLKKGSSAYSPFWVYFAGIGGVLLILVFAIFALNTPRKATV